MSMREFDAVVAHRQSAADEIRAARAYFCWQRKTQSSRDYIEKGLFTRSESVLNNSESE